jgi:hypothetical protein
VDPKIITPILFTALVVWALARRLRRSFGRQRVQPGRIWFRIVVFTLVGVLYVVTSAVSNTQALGAVVVGIVCGAALGYFGLRHTQFEVTPEGSFYTSHTYIGLAVTALFLGRLLYRFLYLSAGANATVGANPNLALAYQRSPMTLGIFAALVGYYLVFYAGVLARTRGTALPMK